MRKVIIGILAALLLSLSLSAKPADATPPGYFYLAPYTEVPLSYHGCQVRVGHGVFGDTSYSYVQHVTGCSGVSLGIQTQAWGKTSSFCGFNQELWGLPDKPDCDVFNGDSALQSIVPNNTGLLGTVLRMGPLNNYNDYIYLKFSPIP